MADFAPPTGPPPPKVPEGWKAIWNNQYNEWFYVNIYTKKSQWDKPDSPVYPPGDSLDAPPGGPPPSYNNTSAKPLQSEKTGASTGEQMFGSGSGPAASTSHQDLTADEQLARKLQAEEDARAHGGAAAGNRGEADGYYQGAPGASPYGQQPAYGDPGVGPGSPGYDQQPAGGKTKGGLFGKLLGKGKSSSSQQQQPQYGYPPQQHGYPPQQPYGYAPQQGYYGQGGYPPQQQAGRRPGGMGAGGAAALGLGGGLLGGVLLGEALDHGGDGGDDGGGDYGGGDYGGGDGGGDFGGGDF